MVFGIYLYTVSPAVTSDDSGELSGVCATLGIAHPSGYPVYSLFGKIINDVLPFANHAYRTNLVAVLFGALTITLVFLFIIALVQNPTTIQFCFAAIFSFMLAFSSHFWSMAVVTEVYTINSFFAVLLIIILLNKSLKPLIRMYLVSFVFSFAMGDHYTLILFLPGILWWAWINRREIPFNYKTCLGIAGFILLGVSVYLFMLVRAQQNPVFSWEDPKTLERFLGLIKRSRYSGLLMMTKPVPVTLSYLIGHVKLFISILRSALSVFGLLAVMVFCCLALIYRFNVSLVLFLFVLFSGYGFFALTRVNITPEMRDLLERFVYLPLVPLCVLAGNGIIDFSQKNKNLSKILLILIILPLILLVKNFNTLNRRNDFIFYDFSRNILKTLPKDSIMFTDRADETDFIIAYLTRIHKLRSDIAYIDCNAGVSKSIYGDNYYTIWGRPRLEIRYNAETNIIANTDRQVFYSTVLPNQDYVINIPRFRYGLLYKVRKSPNDNLSYFPWQELYALRLPLKQDMRSNFLFYSHFETLGDYFLDANRVIEARKQFELLGLITHNNIKLSTIPWWYFNKGNYAKALEEYLKLLELKPDWPEVMVNLGVVYEKVNKIEQAEKMYLRAVEKDPQYSQAYYDLAVLYWRKNDWKKVTYYFTKVLELNPNHSDAKKFLAMAQANTQR
ncbi:MAG: hypothetical protein A2252_05480 [Elusimicrobia bacterium RIFOXYA2_FULL_39_19]|nr:MAG: hypothetical protein A2252_05480 [Elusimicrobia bacterium RIFOXYA2_FULL_39_19]